MTTTEQLAEELAATGRMPLAWRSAFLAVRREWFIPPRAWVDNEDGDPVPLDHDADPDAWRAAVYSNRPILTQFDDGQTSWPNADGDHCTSSASQPELVLRMLDMLDVQPSQRVLEIGTGTGYNAALLAERIGAANVASVEVDPTLADNARHMLTEHGYPVTVSCADGAAGHPPGAPYDRIIATAAVPLGQLPYAWVEQTRPGGLILAPMRTDFAAGSALVRFVVHSSRGIATGHPVGPVGFMPLRQHRTDRIDPADLAADQTAVRVTDTRLKPWRAVDTWEARWAIGIRVPSCQWQHQPPPTPDGQHVLWLGDAASGSWASVHYDNSPEPRTVRQAGPRNLWDEVEAAFRHWKALGRPNPEQSTLTVTAHDQPVSFTERTVTA